MSRHLIALLGLLIAAGGTLALRPLEPDEPALFRIDRLPVLVDGWIAAEGAPEELLPTDPRALRTVRRTYTRNGHSVLLSIAGYPSWNHPEHRPLPDFIAPIRGAGEVAYETLRVQLDGTAGRPTGSAPINLISLQWQNRPLVIAYWYQLNDETVTDEYGLRLRLFVDTLRSRRRAFALIRLAGDHRTNLSEFLHAFYPRFRNLLAS